MKKIQHLLFAALAFCFSCGVSTSTRGGSDKSEVTAGSISGGMSRVMVSSTAGSAALNGAKGMLMTAG